jgi:ribonuclease PH
MRQDGRAPDALRPVSISRRFIKTSAGSALVAFGETKVICTVNFTDRLPAWLRETRGGWVTAEYSMLPGSTLERSDRRKSTGGRAQEISRLVGRSLRGVTDLAALGPCLVQVDCDVIQADGGTRTAAITGAFVALYDALAGSVERGHLPAIPLTGMCAAVSVGLVDGEVLVDLNYGEDFAAQVDMNLVMDDEGRYIEIQGSAEGARFGRDKLDAILAAGEAGVRALVAAQRKALNLA